MEIKPIELADGLTFAADVKGGTLHCPAMDILIDAYRAAAQKEHPDWDEFREAMVRERRRVITVTPTGVVGLIRPVWR